MKMQKSYRYIIYKIRDDMREIQVEECAPRGLYYSYTDYFMYLGLNHNTVVI